MSPSHATPASMIVAIPHESMLLTSADTLVYIVADSSRRHGEETLARRE